MTAEATVDLLNPSDARATTALACAPDAAITSPEPAARRRAGLQPSTLVVGVAVSGALALAAIVVLLRLAGSEVVFETLARIDGPVLAAIIALQLASSATLVQVYRSTHLANHGTLSHRDAATIALGAFSLTQILPGGGAAGGLFAMHRLRLHGADAVRATTTVLLVGLVLMGTLGLVISTLTTLAALRTPAYSAYAVASGALTALLLVAGMVLRALTVEGRGRQRLAGHLSRLRWRGAAVGSTWAASLQQHGGLLSKPSSLLAPVGWAALKWSFDVLLLTTLLRAIGAQTPVLAVFVAFAVAHLLNSLPLTPGGIGIVEAGLAGTLIGFGADPTATAVAVIAYRAIGFWLPVLVAAPLVAVGLRPGRTAGASAAILPQAEMVALPAAPFPEPAAGNVRFVPGANRNDADAARSARR